MSWTVYLLLYPPNWWMNCKQRVDTVTGATSFNDVYDRLRKLYCLLILINTGQVRKRGRTLASEDDVGELAAPFPHDNLKAWLQDKLSAPECWAQAGAEDRARKLNLL